MIVTATVRPDFQGTRSKYCSGVSRVFATRWLVCVCAIFADESSDTSVPRSKPAEVGSATPTAPNKVVGCEQYLQLGFFS